MQEERSVKDMRLEPSEEYMYRRMDWKDRLTVLIPVFGVAASTGLLLIASGFYEGLGAAVCTAALLGIVGAGLGRLAVTRRIMPLNQCFLEIQKDCFVAVQPFRDEEYESCRIFFCEIEGLVKERKNGGFYIRIPENGSSMIQRKERGCVMYVSPLGYPKGQMEAVYQKIRERLRNPAAAYERES